MSRYAVLAALALAAIPAHAAVTVSFVEPQRFTDVQDFERQTRDVTGELARYLVYLGDRYLAPQDKLAIEVLNIDLAGASVLRRSGNSPVRVMTGNADWPRIEVRYTFESGGAVFQRRETIVDRNYLGRPEAKFSRDPLQYEKRMLDEWFSMRFARK
ncbi:MAG TPA: DUF3016 domain-containing protein [Burkholderiales bacterium]|nr:DUF3016 domain-containing protein [Burkholderiales bacterium]